MSEELTDRVLKTIAQAQRIPEEKVKMDSSFEELGIDSMDGVNILFALENEFDITIPDEAAKQIRSIREMVEGVRKTDRTKRKREAAGLNRRVAITGIGVICGIGRELGSFRQNLFAGNSGIRPIASTDVSQIRFQEWVGG